MELKEGQRWKDKDGGDLVRVQSFDGDKVRIKRLRTEKETTVRRDRFEKRFRYVDDGVA